MFKKDRSVISKHKKKIFEDGELNERVDRSKRRCTYQVFDGNSDGVSK